MKLKKKYILILFFMMKESNPFFFELIIDSLRDFNKNLTINHKHKRIIKLRESNKTITLFPIYLNLFRFPTKNLKTQIIVKKVDQKTARRSFLNEQNLLYKFLNNGLNPQSKFFVNDIYLRKNNKINISQVITSTQKIQNIKMI